MIWILDPFDALEDSYAKPYTTNPRLIHCLSKKIQSLL